jgi:hypothetical protein
MKWISVDERLPEDGSWVLAWNKGCVVRGFYHGDWFNEYNSSTMNIYRQIEPITYWMPLPLPPVSVPHETSKTNEQE